MSKLEALRKERLSLQIVGQAIDKLRGNSTFWKIQNWEPKKDRQMRRLGHVSRPG